MPSALWIADYITALGKGKLLPLHIMMMTYMAHGYTLAITKHNLIHDNVEAWKYGPIYPTVYEAVSNYNDKPVKKLYFSNILLTSPEIEKVIKELEVVFSKQEIEIISEIVNNYKDYTGGEIIALMRKDGTPWEKYYNENYMHTHIPNHETKKYYKKLVKNRKSGKSLVKHTQSFD